MSTETVAKYGAAALDHLREAHLLLQLVRGMAQVEHLGWTELAREWERSVGQTIAQMETTDLRNVPEMPLPLRDQLAWYAEKHLTVWLMVRRKDGKVEDVEYEPYSIKEGVREGPALFCYHVEHRHLERLPLARIIAVKGPGSLFTPRYDIEL